MGSAVGQVPDYVEMVTRWCKQHTRMPVIVKLTPNVTDILAPAAAAKRGGADGVSLINTLQAITGVDLDLMAPEPVVDGLGSHGGYCGPAVKPIALRMVADIARAMPDLPGVGHRRHLVLARRRRVHRAWRRQRAGVHRRHAPRVQNRRGHDRRPAQLDGRQILALDRGDARAGDPQLRALERPQSELQDRRADRSGPLHQMRPVSHRLRGHLASGDRRACGSMDSGVTKSSMPNASAATCAFWHARWMVVSPWCAQDTGASVLTWDHHPNNPLRKEAAS